VANPAPAEEISRAFIQSARHFLGNDYLPKIERCLDRLTDEQVWWRPNEESNSIGNLLLHLSGNVRQWIVSGLGRELDQRQRDQEFAQREEISRAELLERLRETLSEVDRVLSQLDLSQMLERRKIQGMEVTTLEAIFHVTEHFSMHTGQIILITKLLTATDLHFYDL
jgi:uncharacterized damage-inducible protein DinB